ncbi:unnamed protein product [Rotaria sordida]|uniref:Transposase n=1 Tax=Rotaria sordida TaxID=392033 RepID=A0A819V7T5_9BILA|nr:unnamed protein product [Rotaria sordida]
MLMQMNDDGMSSVQIAKQLRNVVSQLEGVFNRQNERIYAASRLEADEQKGIYQQPKYPRRLMVWLGTSKNGLTSPIIFKPDETLSHKNYIEAILQHAQAEGERLLGDNFIFQQDHATPHTHRETLAWCEENLTFFLDNHRWPPNSLDLNVLNYYVWDAITNNMQCDKVKDYDSLNDETSRGIRHVPKSDLLRSIENWLHRILFILKTKGAFVK